MLGRPTLLARCLSVDLYVKPPAPHLSASSTIKLIEMGEILEITNINVNL